jgi:hypothetical protein
MFLPGMTSTFALTFAFLLLSGCGRGEQPPRLDAATPQSAKKPLRSKRSRGSKQPSSISLPPAKR